MTDHFPSLNEIRQAVDNLNYIMDELHDFRAAMLFHGMDNLIQPGIVGKWLDSILSGNGLTEAEWELVRNSKKWNPPMNVGVQDDHLYRLQAALKLPTTAVPFEEIVKAVEKAMVWHNVSMTSDQVDRLKAALGIEEVSCDIETVIDVAGNIRGQRDLLAKNPRLEKQRQEVAEVGKSKTVINLIRRVVALEKAVFYDKRINDSSDASKQGPKSTNPFELDDV